MTELTAVDIFNLEEVPTANEISILGISLETPMKEVYQEFNLSRRDLTKSGDYHFLQVKPGFKVKVEKKLFSEEIIAFVITDEFKSQLKGAFAEVFDNIESEDQFKTYVTKYFSEPDQYDSSPPVVGFSNNSIIYRKGFEFTRLNTPEGSTLAIMIS